MWPKTPYELPYTTISPGAGWLETSQRWARATPKRSMARPERGGGWPSADRRGASWPRSRGRRCGRRGSSPGGRRDAPSSLARREGAPGRRRRCCRRTRRARRGGRTDRRRPRQPRFDAGTTRPPSSRREGSRGPSGATGGLGAPGGRQDLQGALVDVLKTALAGPWDCPLGDRRPYRRSAARGDNAEQEATGAGLTEVPLEDPPVKLQPSEMG
jgi:hypothetical protein